jgi:probable HAF family extracellular repeat protein
VLIIAKILTSALSSEQAAASSQCPPRYAATWIPGPDCGIIGFAYLYGWGGNENGMMVGEYACPGGSGDAFISYDGQTLTPLEFPVPTVGSRAVKANDSGAVIGYYSPIGAPTNAFILTRDAFTPITFIPGWTTEASDINENNVVVGSWGNVVTGPFPLSFRWENGVFQGFSSDMPLEGGNRAIGISDNGLITGYMGFSAAFPNHHAYIWNDGQMIDLGVPFANCAATEGRSINSKGHVCGVWWKTTDSQPFFVRRSFFYDGKQMVDLGQYLGWPDLIMQDINETDQLVGFAGFSGAPGWAVLWQNGKFYRLDDLIEHDDVLIEMQSAEEITNDGRIFGYGKVPGYGSKEAIRLTPMPPRPGDVNCDLGVDVDDLLAIINAWGDCDKGQSCQADLNEDSVVNQLDLTTVILDWDK